MRVQSSRSSRQRGPGARGLTMIELALVLVMISGMVIAFRSVPRGEGAAADRAAQARIDSVAAAVFNAYSPGISTRDMTVEQVAQYTTTPVVPGELDLADRRQVSLALGDGTENRPAGYFGAAAAGRDGTCWYMRGRIGVEGAADVSLQTAWYTYSDFLSDPTLSSEAQALQVAQQTTFWCTGEYAILLEDGGPSWQQYTFAQTPQAQQ